MAQSSRLKNSRSRRKLPNSLLCLVAMAMTSSTAMAADQASDITPDRTTLIPMPGVHQKSADAPRSLTLETGAGRIMTLPGGAANIFVADPKIVEVRPASATSLFMFGQVPGRTTVAAMDGAGHLVSQFEVVIIPSGYGSDQAQAAVNHALPDRGIKVTTQGKVMIVTGRVKNAGEAEQVMSIVNSFGIKDGTVDNRLVVSGSIQVGLRVRIVEMSRTLTRDLGLNWQTIGALGSFATTPGIAAAAAGTLKLGSTDINAVLDALSEDNLVRTLAEPNLVTQSGETASFLAGGQFPVPIAQGTGGIGITYQSYGVQLTFVPTVLADNDIVLHVHPEVSDISTANSISVSSGSSSTTTSSSSTVVPGLTVRRADTTVELGSGQSFAIAGLLQDDINHSVTAFPFLGDVPVLGALFRSDSYQRSETELVIVVTPYIVHPINRPTSVMMPDQNYVPPNDIDRFLKLRQQGERLTLPTRHSTSSSGFLVE